MGVSSYLTGIGSRDLAVDLGTANTLVYVRGRGVVLSEPSVVATDVKTGRVRAVGLAAEAMLEGNSGDVNVHRPLKGGVSADTAVTVEMLRRFVATVHEAPFVHPRIVVCVPSGVTAAEKRAIGAACLAAGASGAELIEKSKAAAIGAGLTLERGTAAVVLDIGAGTSEAAVVADGAISGARAAQVGGDDFDRAIYRHCRDVHGLLISAGTAEEVKLEIGSVGPRPREARIEVAGSDRETGAPKTAIATSEAVRSAFGDPLRRIVSLTEEAIDCTPPGLSGAIMDSGITLAGGGSLLQGLAQHLQNECRMPCQVAESPLTCVAVGAGVSLEDFEAARRAGGSPGSPHRKAA